MKKQEIPCEVVKDLLPSYIDALTSEVTNELVAGHLEHCEECRGVFQRMRTEGTETENVRLEEKKEIDFLAKTKKRNRMLVACGILLVSLLFAGGIFSMRYLIGSGRDNPFGKNLMIREIQVDGKEVTLSGQISDEYMAVRSVSFSEEKGIVSVSMKKVLKGIFSSEEFSENYTAKETVKEVRIGDRILWSGGEAISPLVSELFQARHPYIGDNSKNGKLASVLDLQGTFGSYTHELQTSQEPYGWTIHFTEEKMVSGSKRDICRGYASVLLALVENLSEVTFTFPEMKEGQTFTKEEASEYAGEDIKEVGKDIRKLQRFVKKTGM